MNWVDIAWPMLSAVSLTLGLIHGLSWIRQRQQTELLALALLCVGIAAGAFGELLMVRAPTPERYGVVLRWTQVWITLICIAIVWFVHVRYRPGRAWLGALVIATRIACLVPNFTAGMNVNFRVIRSLDFVTLGSSGPLAVPVGEPNPWMTLVAINACLLAAYIANALLVVRRRGDIYEWRNALLTCGSLLFFVVVASAWNRAIVFGVIHAPMLMNPAFVGVILVMSYDVGSSNLRAARLAHNVAVQREQLVHLSRIALLTEISGALAHELSQPLTAMLSNAQAGLRFLGHSPANIDEVREGLLQIAENGKRAGEVVRRLRTMMRKESSDRRPLDLNDVVSDTLQLARTDLSNRNIDLVLDLAPNLPRVIGDRVQLQQVLLNLILNSIQATAPARGSLRISTRSVDLGRVELIVADDGCGIAESDLERIFSPFVTSKADGLGIGLSICASIVSSHGGEIWAQNNAGRGATVAFRLPAPGTEVTADPLDHPVRSREVGP